MSEFVSGSPSLCAVADSARIHLDRRLTAGETRETALAEVRELVAGRRPRVEVLQYRENSLYRKGIRHGEVLPDLDGGAATTPPSPAPKRSSAPFSTRKPRVDKWTFSTNGVAITGIHGIPCIGFGPGDEIMAHAPNEKVAIDDLVKASAFYALYALNMK